MPYLRVAFRRLKKRSAAYGTIVVTIGLALATCGSILALVESLLLPRLPFKDAERIYHVHAPATLVSSDPLQARQVLSVFRDTAGPFAEQAVTKPAYVFELGSAPLVEWNLRPVWVSRDLFSFLGVRPMVGREFTQSDTPSTTRPVIISATVWRAKFGSDRTVMDRDVEIPGTVQNRRWRIVGVMPDGFDFPRGANMWLPYNDGDFLPTLTPDFIRLGSETPVESVRNRFPGVVLTPLREHLQPKGGVVLVLILVAATLLVLTAWLQASVLILADAGHRLREIGTKLALGATTSVLKKEAAAEAAWTALGAMSVALLLVWPLTSAIVLFLPVEITLGRAISPTAGSLASIIGLTCIGFAMNVAASAAMTRNRSLSSWLQGDLMRGGLREVTTLRRLILIAQVTMASVLLYSTGMAVDVFRQLVSVNMGFVPEGLLVVPYPQWSGRPVVTPDERRADMARHTSSASQLLAVARSTEGVVGATFASTWPLGPPTSERSVYPVTAPSDKLDIYVASIGRGYPQIVGSKLLAGREASDVEMQILQQDPDRSRIVLINESLARLLSRYGDPVGQSLSPTPRVVYRVIGVIEDAKQERLDDPVRPMLFTYRPERNYDLALLIKVANSNEVRARLAARMQALWRDEPTRLTMIPLDDAVETAARPYKARVAILGAVALVSLPIVMLGTVGTILFLTQLRFRQIAVRMALGASAAHVYRLVIMVGLRDVTIGVVLGAGALWLARGVFSAYLVGMADFSLITPMIIAGVLVGLAVITSLIAGRIATRLPLGTVLRSA